MEERPQVCGLDVVAEGTCLRTLAEGFGERQKQRHNANEQCDLLVDVIEEVRVAPLLIAVFDLVIDLVLHRVHAVCHGISHPRSSAQRHIHHLAVMRMND